MNKSFCPNCGNNTLKKIAVSIKEDGTMQMHFSRNPKVLNPKGKRVSDALDIIYELNALEIWLHLCIWKVLQE